MQYKIQINTVIKLKKYTKLIQKFYLYHEHTATPKQMVIIHYSRAERGTVL